MVVLLVSITVRGQYNPTNPAEPGATYTLTLKSTPAAGGSFNISSVTSYSPGTTVRLRAYNNSHYTFKCWEEKGEVISTSSQFDYTMPSRSATLTAHFEYNPSNPAEPSVPDIPQYRAVYLSVSPNNSGSFNISSGNRYEIGSSVSLRAYNNSNFVFKNWTENGEVISTSASFNYVVKDTDARIVANFEYSPSNPAEPSEARLSHKLGLKCNPSGGGYFNVSSGNSYQEGTSVSLRAYSNQYYTFQSWSIGDSVINTNYSFSYVMPTHDVTLTANYTYNYNPSNPNEPGNADPHTALYGMTESVIRGQNVLYPIFLENTSLQAKGFLVDVKFPEGFAVNTEAIVISGRGTDHELTVTDLGENNYRLSVAGTEPLSDTNGKVLDIPVTIPEDVEMGKTYPVDLTHGVLVRTDDSQTPISVRDGGLLVERISEDGLYSRFSFDKYQNRVKFTNLSSDKAVRYEWDFGDGTQSTEASPMHIYAQSGVYTARLTVYGETDSDVAEMSVLINDESTWKAQGTYYLSSVVSGVRYFSSMDDLFNMLKGSAINGDIRIAVESGQSFVYDLTSVNLATINQINNALVSGKYTLSFEKLGSDRNPLVQFGKDMTSYNASTASSLFALGNNLNLQGVEFRLWGILFDITQLRQEFSQQVRSGEKTVAADFYEISPDLDYIWSLQANPPAEVSGYESNGESILPSMLITNEMETECVLTYNVSASYQGTEICTFDYEIIITPVLIGSFANYFPCDGDVLPSTALTLTWNSIRHAVYDVYVWNTKNEASGTPVATNLTDTCYTISNYYQFGNSYHWFVKAKNEYQELYSDTLIFQIDKRHLTGDLFTISLPENDITYDGKKHEANISYVEGMGRATFIYTTHGDDTPLATAPINAGEYDIYLEIADGTLYYGMERTYLASFTIYRFDEAEWNSLQALCEELNQYGWANPWDLSQGIEYVSTFQGLQIRQGHVVGIDLKEQNLAGSFPSKTFSFPYLSAVDFSENNLTGDLSIIISDIYAQNPSMTENVTTFNVCHNKYSGNVGVLANCFPNLTSLNCSNNCFEEVCPMIYPAVTDLNLKSQEMDWVVDFDISGEPVEEIVNRLPSILLYNHEQQLFETDYNLLCTIPEIDSLWEMQISYANGDFSIPYVSEQNAYYGDSGDTINVFVLNQYNEFEGSTFKLKLLFEPGDANFGRGVDASDLQTVILYAFGEYKEYPFNYTAANTYVDNTINVQDVVCLVNILLEDAVQPKLSSKGMQRTAQYDCAGTDASIYIQEGRIILNTQTPIAVIDIKAEGNISWNVEKYGMIQSTKQSNLVAYSLSGITLPIGETIIGTCTSDTCIKDASLADRNANPVSLSLGADLTTSITDISNSKKDIIIYDISGRKQNSLKKGANILKKNGRIIKVINK